MPKPFATLASRENRSSQPRSLPMELIKRHNLHAPRSFPPVIATLQPLAACFGSPALAQEEAAAKAPFIPLLFSTGRTETGKRSLPPDGPISWRTFRAASSFAGLKSTLSARQPFRREKLCCLHEESLPLCLEAKNGLRCSMDVRRAGNASALLQPAPSGDGFASSALSRTAPSAAARTSWRQQEQGQR
jgi:hypothetical protein